MRPKEGSTDNPFRDSARLLVTHSPWSGSSPDETLSRYGWRSNAAVIPSSGRPKFQFHPSRASSVDQGPKRIGVFHRRGLAPSTSMASTELRDGSSCILAVVHAARSTRLVTATILI